MTQVLTSGALRTVRMALWVAVLLALCGLGLLLWQNRGLPLPGSVEPSYGDIGGPFELTDEDGRRLSSASLAGKPFAIFFGFTQCPDVCPTSMLEMTHVMNGLGEMARDFRVYFVSVDPERDTPDLLKAYTDSFDPRIIGLTGTPEEIAAVARAYRAFYRKVPTEAGYTMDHTATIYLMSAAGRLTSVISYGEAQIASVEKLRRLILAR
ncbi:SCO family protein [Phreatobacter sp.]|uniref:SCO family protein n=1 Tax=Phreatobacter sp. TaxID=1966341 RepID=UPI0025DFEE08|nr:SCO family protein [Phreatobacter sp.]